MRSFHNQRQRAGPEFVSQHEKNVRHVTHQRYCLLDRTHQDRERLRLRTALGLKYRFDRGKVKWIGRKPVECVGRYPDDFATPDESGGVVHHVTFRRFGRYFKNFDGQFSLAAYGIKHWKTITAIPAQSSRYSDAVRQSDSKTLPAGLRAVKRLLRWLHGATVPLRQTSASRAGECSRARTRGPFHSQRP